MIIEQRFHRAIIGQKGEKIKEVRDKFPEVRAMCAATKGCFCGVRVEIGLRRGCAAYALVANGVLEGVVHLLANLKARSPQPLPPYAAQMIG